MKYLLIVDILCLRMKVVIQGLLFADETPDEELT